MKTVRLDSTLLAQNWERILLQHYKRRYKQRSGYYMVTVIRSSLQFDIQQHGRAGVQTDSGSVQRQVYAWGHI